MSTPASSSALKAMEFARFGQANDTQVITFSPSGQEIAYTWQDHIVYIQCVQTGQVKQHIVTQQGSPIHHLVYSPCGQFLSTVGQNGQIKVWDVFCQNLVASWDHPEKTPIQTLLYTPCGQALLIASENRLIMWDIGQQYEIFNLEYDSALTGMALNSAGTHVAICLNTRLLLLELSTQHSIATYEHFCPLTHLYLLEMGLFFVDIEQDVFCWTKEVQQQTCLFTLPDEILASRFLEKTQQLVFVMADNSVLVFNPLTGMSHQDTPVQADYVPALALSPCGQFFAIYDMDYQIRLVDTRQQVKRILQTERNCAPSLFTLYAAVTSPCGEYIALAGLERNFNGYFAILNAKTLKPVYVAPKIDEAPVYHVMHYSPCGRFLALATLAGEVYLFDTTQWMITQEWQVEKNIIELAYTPTGTHLAMIVADVNEESHCLENHMIQLWDLDSNQVVKTINLEQEIKHVIFSPAGILFFSSTTTEEGAVFHYQLETDSLACCVTQKGSIEKIALSACGKWLATTGGIDNTVRLIDLSTKKQVCAILHPEKTYNVLFSPEGRTLTTTTEQKLFIWNRQTRSLIGEFSHDDHIYMIDYIPDGSQLISASQDGTMKIYAVQV